MSVSSERVIRAKAQLESAKRAVYEAEAEKVRADEQLDVAQRDLMVAYGEWVTARDDLEEEAS